MTRLLQLGGQLFGVHLHVGSRARPFLRGSLGVDSLSFHAEFFFLFRRFHFFGESLHLFRLLTFDFDEPLGLFRFLRLRLQLFRRGLLRFQLQARRGNLILVFFQAIFQVDPLLFGVFAGLLFSFQVGALLLLLQLFFSGLRLHLLDLDGVGLTPAHVQLVIAHAQGENSLV